MNEWRSAKDGFPKEDIKMAVVCNGKVYVADYWYEKSGVSGLAGSSCLSLHSVTHWMPLPDIPDKPTK